MNINLLPDDIKQDVSLEYMELFRALELNPFEVCGPWLAMPTFERFAGWYFE